MSEAFDAGLRDDGQDAGAGEAAAGGAWPTSVQELTDGERLVVWAFRRWVSGPDQQLPLLAREFDRQFRRPDARPALAEFDGALTALSRHARRTIVHHQPCCACLGADEVCILSIVAALQAHVPAAARAMALWLIRQGGADAFLTQLDGFAMRLTASGLDLPYRVRRRTPAAAAARTAARPALALLH